MTAYEWRMNDWSSYVCSSDLPRNGVEDRRFAESRHHADDMDARRPEKAEPGLQIGGLVIEAAQGAPGPRIQRTGRNDDRRPPRCMSDHIAAGVRRERKARLGQQVDIMLHPIGYSEGRSEKGCVGKEWVNTCR